jgi:hypothetical protein
MHKQIQVLWLMTVSLLVFKSQKKLAIYPYYLCIKKKKKKNVLGFVGVTLVGNWKNLPMLGAALSQVIWFKPR